MLGEYVLHAAINPMVYITNGEVESIGAGEGITFEAHVVSGAPDYSFEWFIKEEADPDWEAVGEDGPILDWNPSGGDTGIYDVRCKVTDSQARSGEVIWQGFVVNSSCPVEQIYGPRSEEVILLRNFRDNLLSKTPAGQQMIKLYYDWSPAITEAIAKDEDFKEEVKRMVDPVISLIERTRD
jgi:hypothetical protein